jgi:hypothetical protein
VAIAMAERFGEPVDKRARDALMDLRRIASSPDELVKRTTKIIGPDR